MCGLTAISEEIIRNESVNAWCDCSVVEWEESSKQTLNVSKVTAGRSVLSSDYFQKDFEQIVRWLLFVKAILN